MIFFCRTRILGFENLVFVSVFYLFSSVSLQSFSVKLSRLASFGMYCLINFYAFSIVPFCYSIIVTCFSIISQQKLNRYQQILELYSNYSLLVLCVYHYFSYATIAHFNDIQATNFML